ncbi:cortexillin II [Ethanoligenens sp.]|uniref:cortexillin II n=1 Tax=Ethanoligenens sp. TaxID=2099655 RepID=UPI0039E9ACAB
MARGVLKTPEQKITDLEAVKAKYQERVDGYKAKIAEVDQQIKEISKSQKEAELSKLMQALLDSGKTVDEVLEAIKK